jgi:L-asparaginase
VVNNSVNKEWCVVISVQDKEAIKTDTAMPRILVLGLGGTIAGVADSPSSSRYQAGQLSVDALIAQLPTQASANRVTVETLQVANIDSKDMGWSVWRLLLQALAQHLPREDIDAVVITHGTDTLEETALLLHVLLSPSKPIVLTAAMRPATALDADGPQNLADALTVAAWAAKHAQPAVVLSFAGRVWSGADVRKAHSWHMDAFDGGGRAPLACLKNGQLESDQTLWPQPLAWCPQEPWPQTRPTALALPIALPTVLLLTAHADAQANEVAMCLQQSHVKGVVLACTGHGSWPKAWSAPLREAQANGLVIWRSTRVARGGVDDAHQAMVSDWPAVGELTPAQARLALSLALWCCPQAVTQPPRWCTV